MKLVTPCCHKIKKLLHPPKELVGPVSGHLIGIGPEHLTRTRARELLFPDSLVVGYVDVRIEIALKLRRLAHLDPDVHKSLSKWKDWLIADGTARAVVYAPVSGQYAGENAYIFGFTTEWQRSVSLI